MRKARFTQPDTLIMTNEKGFSLIEVLVGFSILSVVALNITYSSILSYKITKRNIRNSIASQLAHERMEDLAAVSPANLGDTYDETESDLEVENISFTRVTEVTVNADNSRSVTVTVTANAEELGGAAEVSNTFALWGTN